MESLTREGVTQHFALHPGDLIVLVGEMLRPRNDWLRELTERGYVPHGAGTKKVRLLVAADPYSLGGRACKARDCGITIVNEG